MTGTVYAQLAARFDRHHKDPRGLEYLTGEQVVSRLNEVLGPGGWTFEVRQHGYDEDTDEMWVLGEMRAFISDQWVLRQQFGSQKHNRRRADNKVIDYGFDAKGAATDALKKCATLIGVGLYLSEKEGGIVQQPDPTPARGARTPVAAPVATVQDAQSTAVPMINSVDDKVYQRYVGWTERAAALEIEYEAYGVPVERQKVFDEAVRLKALVDAADQPLTAERQPEPVA